MFEHYKTILTTTLGAIATIITAFGEQINQVMTFLIGISTLIYLWTQILKKARKK